MILCQTCGRRPSERTSYKHAGRDNIDFRSCPDPVHDRADLLVDAALEITCTIDLAVDVICRTLDAEKERCAALCEDLAKRARENGASGYSMGIACADRIRAAPRRRLALKPPSGSD